MGKRNRNRSVSTLQLNIRIIGTTGRYMAVANVGGITLPGPACDDEVLAVQSLLWQMGPNAQLGQAPMAIALALEGVTITDLSALTSGTEEDGDGGSATDRRIPRNVLRPNIEDY